MISNKCSKDEIKSISDKMDEVGKRAFRIEIGECTTYDKGFSRKLTR